MSFNNMNKPALASNIPMSNEVSDGALIRLNASVKSQKRNANTKGAATMA